MQTSIAPEGQPVGRAGQVADNNPVSSLSAYNGEASAGIPFGVAVKQGTADQEVKLLSAAGSLVKGVSMFGYDHQVGTTGDLDTDGKLKPAAGFGLMTKGPIYVVVEEAVVAGDRAWVRFETDGGVLTQPGSFRKSDDGHSIDVTKCAIYRTSAAAGGIAKVEVDFTNKA